MRMGARGWLGRGAGERDEGCEARRDRIPGRGPLTQDTTRSRVWGRRAKLTGSRAAPARPAPNEAPSIVNPGGPRGPVAFCPSLRPSGRPRPRPPGAAADAAGWCRRCLFQGARAGHGGGARGGAEPAPRHSSRSWPGALPYLLPAHLPLPHCHLPDPGPRWRPPTRSRSGNRPSCRGPHGPSQGVRGQQGRRALGAVFAVARQLDRET